VEGPSNRGGKNAVDPKPTSMRESSAPNAGKNGSVPFNLPWRQPGGQTDGSASRTPPGAKRPVWAPAARRPGALPQPAIELEQAAASPGSGSPGFWRFMAMLKYTLSSASCAAQLVHRCDRPEVRLPNSKQHAANGRSRSYRGAASPPGYVEPGTADSKCEVARPAI